MPERERGMDETTRLNYAQTEHQPKFHQWQTMLCFRRADCVPSPENSPHFQTPSVHRRDEQRPTQYIGRITGVNLVSPTMLRLRYRSGRDTWARRQLNTAGIVSESKSAHTGTLPQEDACKCHKHHHPGSISPFSSLSCKKLVHPHIQEGM